VNAARILVLVNAEGRPEPAEPEPLGFSVSSVSAAFDRRLSKRDAVRAALVAAIPGWYVPWTHLASTVGIGVAVFVIALAHIHGLNRRDLAIVPITLILSNYFEYRVHKKLLHRRVFPFQILYDRHTPEHHVVYVESDMPIRSTREFKLVLLPAFGVFGIVLTTAPFAFLVAKSFGANVGWLFLVTAAFTLVAYEVLHLSYHLPPSSRIGGSRLIGVLRRHHARHHDPALMQKWNFNVTVPFFDWVFGTIHKER
jgi:sterol desaturase/sphingolipid hydroxylase (fatty acid hydroxylase superfamily)